MFANRHMPARATRFGAPALFNSLWDLDRLFGDLSRISRAEPWPGASAFVPAVDIQQTPTELRVSAELPGLEAGDFEVTTEGNLLTIRGEKKFESTSDENGHRRIERSRGSFERSFQTAWEIDPETVKAVYRNGVLDLVIPKPEDEQSQVRTVPVTGS
jgi:HSP20 family protein